MIEKCLNDPKPNKIPSHKNAKQPTSKVAANTNLKLLTVELSFSVFDNMTTRSSIKNTEITYKEIAIKTHIVNNCLLNLLFQ